MCDESEKKKKAKGEHVKLAAEYFLHAKEPATLQLPVSPCVLKKSKPKKASRGHYPQRGPFSKQLHVNTPQRHAAVFACRPKEVNKLLLSVPLALR
jgi:hypothetical protein